MNDSVIWQGNDSVVDAINKTEQKLGEPRDISLSGSSIYRKGDDKHE